ncbi:hypothetical protein B0O99DRAFT_656719 [Bisporella sp. PMI_857]|nr:hypothetical protein B0O99DRAFT_656719 [Bisporella sp. PMI_857]
MKVSLFKTRISLEYGFRAKGFRRASSKRSLIHRIPFNSWDSHMHVVDPINYPLAPDAQYIPTTHDLRDALSFESTVRIRNIVLVQPSIYGNDNRCMLDALRKLGSGRGRAVVAFDPQKISVSTLEEWHRLGVRGVRFNLQSIGKQMNEEALSRTLEQYANIIRPFNWVLQLYVPLATVIVLEKIVPSLRVKVCLDHFGQPTLPDVSERSWGSMNSHDPYLIPGFESLARMLREGNTYLKMSAPYRISGEERSLDAMAKEILRLAGNRRVVFATDWPHTRFEGLDIKPFVEQVVSWCDGDESLVERVFKSNAEDLWDISH